MVFLKALTFVLEYFSFIVGITYSYIQIECQSNVNYSGLTKISYNNSSNKQMEEIKRKERARKIGIRKEEGKRRQSIWLQENGFIFSSIHFIRCATISQSVFERSAASPEYFVCVHLRGSSCFWHNFMHRLCTLRYWKRFEFSGWIL